MSCSEYILLRVAVCERNIYEQDIHLRFIAAGLLTVTLKTFVLPHKIVAMNRTVMYSSCSRSVVMFPVLFRSSTNSRSLP